MTIDEAIKHCRKTAQKQEQRAKDMREHRDEQVFDSYIAEATVQQCSECAADHRQLAEWLTELKEAKRLLKLAVEGYSFIGHITNDYACPSATSCSACPMDEGKQCRIWKHADEALALIGGGRDVFATDTNVGSKGGAENEEQ